MSRFLGGFILGAADSTIKRRQVSGVHRVLQFAQLLDAQGLHVKGWENHYLNIKYDMGFEPPATLEMSELRLWARIGPMQMTDSRYFL